MTFSYVTREVHNTNFFKNILYQAIILMKICEGLQSTAQFRPGNIWNFEEAWACTHVCHYHVVQVELLMIYWYWFNNKLAEDYCMITLWGKVVLMTLLFMWELQFFLFLFNVSIKPLTFYSVLLLDFSRFWCSL